MKDIMRNEPASPKIADRTTFQAELDALRIREKAYTRAGDAIAATRRRLPMVEVDGATALIGERGAVTLLDAFGTRSGSDNPLAEHERARTGALLSGRR